MLKVQFNRGKRIHSTSLMSVVPSSVIVISGLSNCTLTFFYGALSCQVRFKRIERRFTYEIWVSTGKKQNILVIIRSRRTRKMVNPKYLDFSNSISR